MKELTMKITEKAVQACVVPEGQRFVTICDAVQEGLVVRKTRAGDMDYLVRYYDAAGIGYEAPMAAVGDISGNEAREFAEMILANVEGCKKCPFLTTCGAFLPSEDEVLQIIALP
ncbi:hypothetical protein [Paenalcaligenes faecalis]|uniref:hypothetical protein n=1 Tax=Paenalcaligenes faecalis TaxID=2980099 RepID=UPI0022B95EE6|nr:hypothetical protein [Paenalcaligenes faecalis]